MLVVLVTSCERWRAGTARPPSQSACSVRLLLPAMGRHILKSLTGTRGHQLQAFQGGQNLEPRRRHEPYCGILLLSFISCGEALLGLCVCLMLEGELPSTRLSAWPMASCPVTREWLPQAKMSCNQWTDLTAIFGDHL